MCGCMEREGGDLRSTGRGGSETSSVGSEGVTAVGAVDGSTEGVSGDPGEGCEPGVSGEGCEGVSGEAGVGCEGVSGEAGVGCEGVSGDGCTLGRAKHRKLPTVLLHISSGEQVSRNPLAHSSISEERDREGAGPVAESRWRAHHRSHPELRNL